MLRNWLLLLFPLLFFSSFSGCSDDPDDEWSDNNDSSIGVSDNESSTLDGAPAFARFEDSQLEVSSDPTNPIPVVLYTNLSMPYIEVDTDVAGAFIYANEVTPPDMENGGLCEVMLEVTRNILQHNTETGVDEALSRQGSINVVSGGKTLATLNIVQEAPPYCKLNGNIQSTFSRLSFPFTASESTAKVYYYLSDKALPRSEASGILYDRWEREELVLSEGQTEFTLDFNGLLVNTPYYLYVRPVSEYGSTLETNYFSEYTASTAAGQSEQDLVLLVSANPANNFTVYIPFHSDYTTGTLDWGDGTVETVADGFHNIQHKYDVTTATEFEVRFSGKMTNMSLSAPGTAPISAMENTLLGILQWGYTGLEEIDLGSFTSLSYVAPDTQGAFRNMKHFGVEPYGGSFTGTSITEIPEGFFDYAVNATSFDFTFGECSKLASLPKGLFKNCTKAKSFQRTFISCTSLTELPADLFSNCPEVTTFETTFNGCSELKEIPAGLFDACTKVVNFEGTFGNCTSLTSIPAGLFIHNKQVNYIGTCARRNSSGGYLNGGRGLFQGCTNLKEIPAGLFASFKKLEDASFAFTSCRGLKTLPADLFSVCTSLEYLESTFEYCSSLQSLPVSLFDNNRQLRIVGSLFEGCSALSGESPYTTIGNGTKVHLYERSNYNTEFVAPDNYVWCFRHCTGLSDYDAIPNHWN